MTTKLKDKTLLVKTKEQQIEDLLMLIKKFQSQAIKEKDLIRLVTSDKNYSDYFTTGTKSSIKLEPIGSANKNKLSGNK